MQYRHDNKSDKEISALGFGCMRLPKESEAETMILRALDLGVNYFDTAYAYPGSEEMLGRIMERNGIRDRMLVATKLPHGKCKSTADVERLFTTSLTRMKTDHVEYYLIHNVVELSQWERLVELGIEEWIAGKKASGAIESIGFSFHGATNEFEGLLNAYPWDFCQIQYNYMNEHFQAGRTGLEAAEKLGIPVIIMEPLLGGRLAKDLPKKAAAAFHEADPDASFASWSLRWLWDQPGVTCVLSGMNAMPQLEDNVAIASATSPHCMTEQERAAISKAKAAFEETFRVPCTGCNYCMPCPKGINIPAAFAAYNNSYTLGLFTGWMGHFMSAGAASNNPRFITDCVNCGACVSKCPQHIDIPEKLREARRRVEPAPAVPLVRLVGKLMN